MCLLMARLLLFRFRQALKYLLNFLNTQMLTVKLVFNSLLNWSSKQLYTKIFSMYTNLTVVKHL